jgi:protein SCO1/2
MLQGASGASAELVLPAWPQGTPSPAYVLQDTHGHSRSLADLHGKVVALYFGFASCPELCPLTVSKLSQARKSLGPLAAGVQLVFVTLDPENDSAEALGQFTRALDPSMLALTGTPQMIAQAASAFGVQYARVSRNGMSTIDHSGAIYLIDASGRLRVVAPPDATPGNLSHDLRALLAERGPAVAAAH